MSEITAFDERVARRFIRIGGTMLLLSIAGAFAGSLIQKHVAIRGTGTAVIRIIGVLLDSLGVAFAILAALLVVAGLLQRLCVRAGRAGTIVVGLILMTAVVLFLITPFCWDQRSDDCRSLGQRISALF